MVPDKPILVAAMARPHRNEGAERLGTPEHLDRTLHVITTKGWLALVALGVMLGAVLAWSILGEVTTYVRADRIIQSRGGAVSETVSSGNGRLSRIFVAVGDAVAEGEVVAEISDAATMERYAGALATVDEHAQVLRWREAEAEEENALADLNPVSVRNRMGGVLQNGRVIAGSIFENIAGRSQLDAVDAWAAVRGAALDDDIRAMPTGMRTMLPEGEVGLSAGQKQCLPITRRPRILLFDEATSALDNRSQAMVQASPQADQRHAGGDRPPAELYPRRRPDLRTRRRTHRRERQLRATHRAGRPVRLPRPPPDRSGVGKNRHRPVRGHAVAHGADGRVCGSAAISRQPVGDLGVSVKGAGRILSGVVGIGIYRAADPAYDLLGLVLAQRRFPLRLRGGVVRGCLRHSIVSFAHQRQVRRTSPRTGPTASAQP